MAAHNVEPGDIVTDSRSIVDRANGLTGPVVETTEGKLRGSATNRLKTFKGVHYGESTAGNHRFRPPRQVVPWCGVREATALGDPCFQNNPDWQHWKEASNGSEDCLVLNVWAPVDGQKRPVMVFFHGGAYFYGSGGAPMYDGGRLAEKGDVVVVTVNHRLHILGFMHLADHSEKLKGCANVGLLDLVEALRWIRRNIAAFGGDPQNVTIFGESGGGGKVSCLMAMPAAAGLFQKAIVQSGSQLHVRSREDAMADTVAALRSLSIDRKNLSALQSVPLQTLWDTYMKVSQNTLSGGFSKMPFSPVIDPDTLPFQPGSAHAMELSKDVAMIVGANDAEGIFYLLLHNQLDEPKDDPAAVAKLQAVFPRVPDAKRPLLAELLQLYRQKAPAENLLNLTVMISSELWMGRDATQQAEDRIKAGCAPVYLYRFGWQEPFMGGYWAIHGAELPFIFDKLEVNNVWGDEDTLAGRQLSDPQGKRYTLRDGVTDAWSSFAHAGRPISTTLPDWKPYSIETRPIMRLDAHCEVVSDPFGPAIRNVLASLDAGIGA
ncbi:carboxylesterase/lipase family protein [Bradyrhizobium sp. Arg314]